MKQSTLYILRLLNDGKFQSCNTLARKLCCNPETISNALKDLVYYGIEIDKIRGRGYRWINPIVYLDKDLIFRYFTINPSNFNITLFDTLDSTNTFLLNKFKKGRTDNCSIPVVATEYQTNGRGRAGRLWQCGFGDSITFSFCWRFEQGISALSGLSLIIGIAVIRVLRSFVSSNVSLKWPNDILFDNRKLAGILIELRGEIFGPSYAIIGIGINYKLSDIIKSFINQEVTDLSSISEIILDRNQILSALLTEFLDILPTFSDYGFTPFMKEWISYHAFEGKAVSLILPNGNVIVGTVDGVVDDGSICLVTSTGRNSYNVGDISIRLNAFGLNDAVYTCD